LLASALMSCYIVAPLQAAAKSAALLLFSKARTATGKRCQRRIIAAASADAACW
jgi:hypothetical protein